MLRTQRAATARAETAAHTHGVTIPGLRGATAFAWLDDAVDGGGVAGAEADRVVAAEHVSALDTVECLWRQSPHVPWVGWLTYDLGAASLLERAPRTGVLPGLLFRRYPTTVQQNCITKHSPLRWPLTPLSPQICAATYRRRVATAKAWIAAGETYQVNLSQIFHASWQPWAKSLPFVERVACLYTQIRTRSPASMGALIAANGHFVVSNSPETLIDIRLGQGEGGGDLIRSWPIKGTRPRSADPTRDRALARELLASSKDAAEHVMIVDLVRNDLGRLAIPGTVRARAQPTLMRLPTVHHLVTEVRATLRPGWCLREVMAAVFPGGSITGAPKRRTCELIDELEGVGRGLYCGAIVHLEATGLRCSIPIRTALVSEAGLVLHSGGGIVADSDPEQERLETLDKVRAFESSTGTTN